MAIYDCQKNHRLAPLPYVEGDLARPEHLQDFFEAHAITAVIHCAGKIDVAESLQKPALYHRYNVQYTEHLLQVMVNCGIRDVIFSSSCSVYGQPEHLPLTESHPLTPLSPYGKNKKDAEALLRKYEQREGIRSISLRFFNAAGAAPDGTLGECHEPETHLIPRVLGHLMQHTPLAIYGEDYPTPDGTCVRDYIHVWDLARAHLKALRYLQTHHRSDIFNLGSDRGYSVKEVIAAAEAVTGKQANPSRLPRRPGDPAVLVSSSERARRMLDWRPDLQLQDMVKDAWRFMQREACVSAVQY